MLNAELKRTVFLDYLYFTPKNTVLTLFPLIYKDALIRASNCVPECSERPDRAPTHDAFMHEEEFMFKMYFGREIKHRKSMDFVVFCA